MVKTIKAAEKVLAENYETFVKYSIDNSKKEYLGKKENYTCRFCGESKPEKFKSEAHAIPHFVGNNQLFTYYECDICNNKFARLLENEMANFMHLKHTSSQIEGKKKGNGKGKIPKFKNNSTSIEVKNDFVEIKTENFDEVFNDDEKSKSFTITEKQPSFIPIAVYKCLTKMALTIMPEEEIINFKDTLNWISEENHNESKFKTNNLIAFETFIEGQHPTSKNIGCYLVKRKAVNVKNVPYMMFFLIYGNYAFQIHLPFSQKDRQYIGKEIHFIKMIIPYIKDKKWNIHKIRNVDLNSKAQVKGKTISVTFGYDSKEVKDFNL